MSLVGKKNKSPQKPTDKHGLIINRQGLDIKLHMCQGSRLLAKHNIVSLSGPVWLVLLHRMAFEVIAK